MRRLLLAFLLAFASVLLAEDVPQAVKALQHLKPRTDVGPFSWTAGEYRYDGAGDITSFADSLEDAKAGDADSDSEEEQQPPDKFDQ
ncbi:MAG TPA: hypothetical protein VGR02_12415 [Thermoanaerobaculia bacterium]|jgi:hypothetical protein|nr:hypothetical protein [Thermoanaerobaculia bacterium]